MVTFSDDLGDAVVLPEPDPTRAPGIVSLVPSLTEALAVSMPGCLIGATDWCTHPGTLDVTRIGGTKNPDVDTIVEMAPDLVVANEEENKREHVEALRAAGVQVWVTDIRTVQDALVSIGRLLDALQAPHRTWLEQARAAWDRPEPTERRTVLVPIWRRPWMVAGRDTYAADVLRRLGYDVVPTGEERYPRFDLEDLDALRPDLVALPDEPYAFSPQDGPEAFPGIPCALVDGRRLTWYGPAMTDAPTVLVTALEEAR